VTCCSLSDLNAEPISELNSTHGVVRVAELVADVDGMEGCDWSECELPPLVVARSRDGLSLMASS
jgi:hypothetical protein